MMIDDLVVRLRWGAFKFCGRGEQENLASDAMSEAADYIEKLERKRSIISASPPTMTDGIGRVWKRNEDGHFCLVPRNEYRKIFLLRRKKVTYKAIGNIYQIHYGTARQLFFRYMRLRHAKVREYLETRSSRGEGK
jgi:hypothetical protein